MRVEPVEYVPGADGEGNRIEGARFDEPGALLMAQIQPSLFLN